jgi:hypothetical protein
MTRATDPLWRARERLTRLARQEAARAEARAVAEGVAETVALSRQRGAAIEAPAAAERKARARPYRRQSGLEWLGRKGRLSAAARAAGERYGAAYRRAKAEPSVPSTLNIRLGGGDAPGQPLAEVLARGEGTVQAAATLAGMRRRLMRQPDLVAACDLICGEEKTPREAGGDDRQAARLEAVLKVALDLLSG